MDEELIKQLFEMQRLHDFNPQANWQKKHQRWVIVWIILFLAIAIMIFLLNLFPMVFRWIILITLVILLGISFWIHFDLNNSLVAINWDNMDYQNFKKMDFPFIANDGTEHATYFYIPKSLEFSKSMMPQKTIISFHGWGSHHREMDRYCLPAIEQLKCLYFTIDSFGLGQTPGSKNDFNQFQHAKDYIETVLDLPFVDKTQVAVVGMSLGAAKTAYAAYTNPNIRALVMLSSPFDMILTKENMTKAEYLIFRIFGFSFNVSQEKMKEYSAIHLFQPEGIVLTGDEQPTPNSDRIFLLANEDDPAVTVNNTYNAIAKLRLPKANYRIFPRGKHAFKGNEPFVAMEVYQFLKRVFE